MAVETTGIKTTGTLYLIIIQILSRGLTFAGNQAVLRYVSPADLGLAIQLEALSISVLYTSRESLRVALQRKPKLIESKDQDEQENSSTQAAINAAHFVVLLGLMIGVGFMKFYLRAAGPDVKDAQDFGVSLQLYATATIIEFLSEPGFLVVQEQALFKARAFAETTAAIFRCIAAVSTTWYIAYHKQPASTLPFATGQLAYATVLLILYQHSARKALRGKAVSLIPQQVASQDIVMGLVPRKLLTLAGAFYGQSIFKWLLTQGDTLVLSYFADLKSQGIFALASNYGGLSSRLLFQPIEESSRTLFGRLFAVKDGGDDSPQVAQSGIVSGRKAALQHLSTVVHGYLVMVAVPCTTLLPKVFPIVVRILLGTRSSFFSPRTASLLAIYSYYVPFLALNGILDAFVTSVASEAELAEQSIAMAGVTILYVSTAAGLMVRLESAEVGLVYANILNMILRILFSLWFIRAWITQNIRDMKGKVFHEFAAACLPTRSLICAWTVIEALIWSEEFVKDQMKLSTKITTIKVLGASIDVSEIAAIASIAIILLSSILFMEHTFILQTFGHLVPSKLKIKLDTVGRKDSSKKSQ